ncbi:tRNA (cytosine(72)-C(5))-methyltransferase NSUN6 isoform X3 [Tribolium castaneum]|uniref:tRNA (cytosine(72)-C(5))-methyltransferase NSUN6 isoform X3 n=1 Tax=Tribolium castaneum TaxID=7070 RepID=UPI0030FEBFAD
MPYPESPFGDDFDAGILVRRADDDETNVSEIQIGEVTKWLCQAPKITSFRVNTLKADVGEAHRWIRAHVSEAISIFRRALPISHIAGAGLDLRVERHPSCADAVIVHHPVSHQTPQKHNKEIVVDAVCGAAVLRGAHIYAPGVIGMMSNIQIGDNVSIYVDLDKKCKKGFLKLYNGKKTFIGNGEVILGRNHLFCETPQTGLAIKMIETISSCPPVLGDNFLPPGAALLQNLPSIICTHVLAPCPNDTILDMCASPGNKTTHIAALLKNQAVQLLKTDGTLVYSTCTITLAENEGIVAWALKNFKLELVEAAPILGGPGWDGTQLTSEQLKKVQRFGPHQSIDSVGFFIAKFVKK